MKKIKLTEVRKAKGFSQRQVTEKLCMDVSNYYRREKGLAKINIVEWNKLSRILDVPLESIYEPEKENVLINKQNNFEHSVGTINFCSVPTSLIHNQQKYIQKLEEEIASLKHMLTKE